MKDVPSDRHEAIRLYNRILDLLVRASIQNGGGVNELHGIVMRFIRFMKDFSEEMYNFSQIIKKALDPESLLNPGKLGLGE